VLRFTIRDVLWVTMVVALAVGWWLDRARLSARVSFLQRGANVVTERFSNSEDRPITVTIDDRSWP